MGNFQRFRGLIFEDGCSRTAPNTLPVGSASYCIQLKTSEMGCESHTMEAMVRGYHVYKEIWCAAYGEELSCMREVENYCNPFAVAVVKSGVIVGHVPRKILSVCWMFLGRGGTISCKVTGSRRYSEDLPQGELEVPCVLILRGAHSNINKSKALLKCALLSNDCAVKDKESPKKKPKHPRRSLNLHYFLS